VSPEIMHLDIVIWIIDYFEDFHSFDRQLIYQTTK